MTEITEAGLAIAAQPATRPGLQREIAGIIIRDVLQEDQDDLVEGYFDEIMQAAKRIALLPAYNVVARAFETNAAEHMLKAAAECTRLQEELTRLQAEVEGLRGALESIALRANGEPWPDHFAPEPPDWAQDEYGCAASCGYCGAWMTIVRPGKHQCDNCSDGQDVGAIACALLQAAREEASGAGNKIAAGLSEALAFAKGDASSATVRHVRVPSQGAGEPVAWPISVDGPHKITDQRAWLARQLMDSKNSDEEAFGIVAYHPAIRGARPANDRTKALEEALETARDALQAAYQRTGHADDLAAAHIADAAHLRTLETSNV